MANQPFTSHHAGAGLACLIAQRRGHRQIALRVPPAWNGSPATLTAAATAGAIHPAHSALVVLVQNCAENGWQTTDCEFYLNYVPTNADKGIFIEQCGGVARITYRDVDGTVKQIRPTKTRPNGQVNNMPLPEVNAGGWKKLKFDVAAHWRPTTVDGGTTYRVHHLGDWRNIVLPTAPAAAATDTARAKLFFAADDNQVMPITTPPSATLPGVRLPARPRVASTYGGLGGNGQRLFDEIALCTALALVPMRRTAGRAAPLADVRSRGNDIASILYDEGARILAWGLNTRTTNAAHHAEVSTCKRWQQSWGAKPIPARSRLYTTLEPCFMCSGLLADAYGTVPGFLAIYAQEDPACSSGGRQTFLDVIARSVDSATLGVRFGTSGTTWSAKLTAKQAQFALATPKYAASTVSLLTEQIRFGRRFAKAGMQLAGIGAQIVAEAPAGERPFLTEMWKNALFFLTTAGGYHGDGGPVTGGEVRGMLLQLADDLLATRGGGHGDASKFSDQVDALMRDVDRRL